MISVIMSIYKEKIEWVKKSVYSILNQTYKDIEFIIVIDNPNIEKDIVDFLHKISLEDNRIVVLQNNENIGLANSLNKAITIARGEYIARMDADDISFENRLLKEIDVITKLNVDVVFTNQIRIDEFDNILKKGNSLPINVDLELQFGNFITHPSVLIKTSVIKQIGGYRNFRRSQDYDLWLRMISGNYKFAPIDEYLIYYRVTSENLSNKHKLEQYYVSKYQKKLFYERKKYGKDSFSEEQLEKYLKKKHITPDKNSQAIKCFNYIELCKTCTKKKDILINAILAFITMPNIFLGVLINYLRKKIKKME